MNHIIIFALTLAIIYGMWVALSNEEGFLLSTKRLGGILVVMLLIVQIIILTMEGAEKEQLLIAVAENNITLPPNFKQQLIDTKLSLASAKLAKELK